MRPATIFLVTCAALFFGGPYHGSTCDAADAKPPGKKEQADQQERIGKLIRQLGDDSYAVRERAQQTLARLGIEALDDIAAAQYHDDLEIAARARLLVRSIRIDWVHKDDPPLAQVILKGYGDLDEPARLARAGQLALLLDAAATVPLLRMVRFDNSDRVSKQAALTLLGLDRPVDKQPTDSVIESLGRSTRPAARWLRAELSTAGESQRAAAWQKLIEAESVLLIQDARNTDRAVVIRMIERQLDRHLAAGRNAEAAAAAASMVDHVAADPLELKRRLYWFGDRQAWFGVDLLEKKFGGVIDREDSLQYAVAELRILQGDAQRTAAAAERIVKSPVEDSQSLRRRINWLALNEKWSAVDALIKQRADVLNADPRSLLHSLYAVAQSHRAQGRPAQAKETADRAFSLVKNDQTAHALVAEELWRRGLYDWAQREYEHVLKLGGDYALEHVDLAVAAQMRFAARLHDRGRDARAAKVLEETAAGLKRASQTKEYRELPGARRYIQQRLKTLAAGADSHRGYDRQRGGDRDQAIELFQRSIEGDPSDADVLIALYRLSQPGSELRTKTVARIDEMARDFRDRLRENFAADEMCAMYCNQLAWLVSNTRGDQHEALRLSRKSLELNPGVGGYYDTLARCYYACGDLASAVKYQRLATRLEPHSGLIAAQLKLFESDREKKPDGRN